MVALIACTFVLGIGTSIMGCVFFDRLLRVLFSQHRTEWERCGHPLGFFWVPKDAKTERSGMARSTVFTGWSFRTPGWVTQSPESLLTYRLFKRATIAAWVFFGLYFAEMVTLIAVIFTGAST
jgi:hypothetical protein